MDDSRRDSTSLLSGISILVSDDSCEFYKTCPRDEALEAITVGVLTVSEDGPHQGPSSVNLQPISTAIILEGSIVIDNIKDLPQAVCPLFGLTYALQFGYPKCMANALKFIRTVMLGLGKKTLSPKLLSLKNSLLSLTSEVSAAIRSDSTAKPLQSKMYQSVFKKRKPGQCGQKRT